MWSIIVCVIFITVFDNCHGRIFMGELNPETQFRENDLIRLRRQLQLNAKVKLNRPYHECTAPSDKKGHCRHLRFCPMGQEWANNARFVDYLCVIDNSVVGVCCPDDFVVGPPSAGANIVANLPATGDENFVRTDSNKDQTAIRGCGMKSRVQHTHASGAQAEPNEWPWMAALLKREQPNNLEFFCGGSLITDQHILTAAHCTNPLQATDIIVRLGEYDFSKRNETRFVDFTVLQVASHADFDTATYENDIAVLKLNKRTTFNTYIWPICLPPPGLIFANVTATVTGWGREFFGGPTTNVLMEVSMPVWDNERCAKSFTQPITEKVLCAAAYEGGKDSCQGDSGGPLQYQLENGNWVHIGVVSWGIRCGTPGRPGVYTRVNRYLSWIIENTV